MSTTTEKIKFTDTEHFFVRQGFPNPSNTGLSHFIHLEVKKPLTLDDFTFEEGELENWKNGNEWSIQLQLTMKPEVAEEMTSLNLGERYRNEILNTFITKTIRKVYTFKGCRSDEAKDKKWNEARTLLIADMHDNRDRYVQELVNDINELIQSRVQTHNKNYCERIQYTLTKNLDTKWMKETIKTVYTEEWNARESENKDLTKQIMELKDKRKQNEIAIQHLKNKGMLEYMEQDGWELNGSKFPADLVTKISDIYRENKAFELERHGFLG